MPFKFSSKLIAETILCFKEEEGLEISEETAEEYLNGLSGLFLAFAEMSSRQAHLVGGAGAPADLITPHSCKNKDSCL
jgi:hypothetical protein